MAELEKPVDEKEVSEHFAMAKEIVTGYHLVVEQTASKEWICSSLEFPFVLSSGKTPEEAVQFWIQAQIGAIIIVLGMGRVPPKPIPSWRKIMKLEKASV